MSGASQPDRLLVERIRRGDGDAWGELISRYEGRLLAFVESRLSQRSAGEDIVQEAFVGFLNSLPNYDGGRPLESYLFSICAYKLTDHLRKEGRRPSIPLSTGSDSGSNQWQLSSRNRAASSVARGREREELEEQALREVLREQCDRWKSRGDFQKLKCIELLFVRGWANKNVAAELDLTEQQVANFKFDFITRTRTMLRRQGLSSDVFPDL